MTNVMPKFSTQDTIEGTKEEFEQQLEKGKGLTFLTEPGRYAFKITAPKFHKMAPGDPNWAIFDITLTTPDGKDKRVFPMAPLKRINNYKYGQKQTMMVYQKLSQFLASLGVHLQFETAQAQISAIFKDITCLEGKTLEADLGYHGPYAAYQSKGVFHIISKGVALKDEAGETLLFPDKKAAENYADTISLKLEAFIDVLSYVSKTEEVGEESNDETESWD